MLALSNREKALVDFTVHIALGDQVKTINYLKTLLANKTLSAEDIENVLLHQIVYCDFPCAMNDFAALIETTSSIK